MHSENNKVIFEMRFHRRRRKNSIQCRFAADLPAGANVCLHLIHASLSSHECVPEMASEKCVKQFLYGLLVYPVRTDHGCQLRSIAAIHKRRPQNSWNFSPLP